MGTNIADEYADIGRRMRELANEEGKLEEPERDVVPLPTGLFWCYSHGMLGVDQVRPSKSRGYLACRCDRPVLKYCSKCDCTGWVGRLTCPDCRNPFSFPRK